MFLLTADQWNNVKPSRNTFHLIICAKENIFSYYTEVLACEQYMFFLSLCCVPTYIVTKTNVSPRDDIRLCVLKTKVKWNKLKTLTVVWGCDLIFHAREDSGWHPAVTKHSRWYCLEFILKELFSAVSRYWQQMTRTKPVLKNVLAHHSLPYLICASKPDILHLHSSSQPLY